MKKALSSFLVLFVLVFANCTANAADKVSGSIQIKGSDTMVNLGQAWAEEFMAQNPDANIAVTGGGSGTGIAAIINGTCDIAQSSRKMKQQELDQAKAKGYEVEEHEVGIDALAVIVHPNNPVSQLSVPQLSDIFTGKIKDWSEVGGKPGPIVILSRERNSGTHVYFLEHIVRKGNEKGPEEYAEGALMMPSSQAIADEVATNDTGIGYVGLGYVTDKHKKVAIGVAAEGPFVQPTLDTALDKSYPISRALLMYTIKNPSEIVKAFVEFSKSDKGQEIVQMLDFVPLRKKQ